MSARFNVPVGEGGVVKLGEVEGRRVHTFMRENGVRFISKEALAAFIRDKYLIPLNSALQKLQT